MTETPDDHLKRLPGIREEMRFEITLCHDHVNALISAEAFILISFTRSSGYANAGLAGKFFWITPTLSVVGFTLAVLAWPGLDTICKIIVEWNVMFVDALNEAHTLSTLE